MASDRTGSRSPVIIMSQEFNETGQAGVWEAGRMRLAAEADQSSCLPLLVVPGTTPRSSTSSQSCLSVPGISDINGYITHIWSCYLPVTHAPETDTISAH